MARKMTIANEALFKKLTAVLPQELQHSQREISHWIQSSNEEKNWLKNAKIEKDDHFDFDKINKIAIASLNGDQYLICSGLQPNLPSEDFEYYPLNSGIFIATIVDLDIQPLIREDTHFELAENIFIPILDYVTTGIEHSLTSIEKYFPKISLYKIPQKSPFRKLTPALARIGLFVTTKCRELHHLNWSEAGLETARVSSTLDIEIFPYELILRAITERKWTHAFLEAYRAIEFLYPLPKINELKSKLKSDLPIQEISELIEDTLGWRPTEEGALQGLFKNLPANLHSDFGVSFNLDKNNLPDSKKIATMIYKLRNDCVHFRPAQKTSALASTVNWQLLLQTMLGTADFCYRQQMTANK